MLNAIFVLADCLYRTYIFARYRNIYYGVVRTTLVADAATDTFVVVNLGLAVVLEVYCILRAVHVAASCHTTTAKVCNLIV